LPDFQCERKWDDERIKALIATVTLDCPLGVVMTLESLSIEDGRDVLVCLIPVVVERNWSTAAHRTVFNCMQLS
jgi:hypothetical protein